MAKRKKAKVSTILTFVLFALGLVATVMLFLPALGYTDSDTTFTGANVAFGYTFASAGSLGSGKMGFSILGALAFLLPVIAGLISLLMGKNKIMFLVSGVLFLASAVLLFLLPEYTKVTITIMGSSSQTTPDWSLQYGSIIAAVCSSLGVLVSGYSYIR